MRTITIAFKSFLILLVAFGGSMLSSFIYHYEGDVNLNAQGLVFCLVAFGSFLVTMNRIHDLYTYLTKSKHDHV